MALRAIYQAVCEDCGAVSGNYDGPRELAVIRLLRDDWIVRKDDTAKCPKCAGPPSIKFTPRGTPKP
jgi:hypothetical protein